MEENKKNLVQFRMSDTQKFISYTLLPIIYPCFSLFLYVIIILTGSKKNILNSLLPDTILPGFLFILALFGIWKTRRSRFATTLMIDRDNRKFGAYIYDINKDIIFTADEIKEIGDDSLVLRFILNDGTWVSWIKDKVTQPLLDEIIQSFTISKRKVKLW